MDTNNNQNDIKELSQSGSFLESDKNREYNQPAEIISAPDIQSESIIPQQQESNPEPQIIPEEFPVEPQINTREYLQPEPEPQKLPKIEQELSLGLGFDSQIPPKNEDGQYNPVHDFPPIDKLPESPIKKGMNIFKFLFFVSLFIFLGVLAAIFLTINNQQLFIASIPTPSPIEISPTLEPTAEPTDVEEIIPTIASTIAPIASVTATVTKKPTPSSVLKTYINKTLGFSVQYPQSLQIFNTWPDNSSKPYLVFDVQKISTLDFPLGNDSKTATENKIALEKGEFGPDIFGNKNSRRVVKINDTVYGKEFMTLGQIEVCDVQLRRELLFYINDYQVRIGYVFPVYPMEKRVIIPQIYLTNDPINCGKAKIWKSQDEFYKVISSGALENETLQNWYNDFEKIIQSIKLN